MKTLTELVDLLTRHPDVIGLLEYGSSHFADARVDGDYDLIVVLDGDGAVVEGLHFFVKGTPVDLNIRTLQQIQDMDERVDFDAVVLESRVLHDRTGAVSQALRDLKKRCQPHPPVLSEHEIAVIRHGHRHILDKVACRLETMPVFCRHMLHAGCYWLVQNYFRVRNLRFRGEKHALAHIEEKEPALYERIAAFYDTHDLDRQVELLRDLTDLVLEPIGGAWQDDEVLAFGGESDIRLQEKGFEMYERLFSTGVEGKAGGLPGQGPGAGGHDFLRPSDSSGDARNTGRGFVSH